MTSILLNFLCFLFYKTSCPIECLTLLNDSKLFPIVSLKVSNWFLRPCKGEVRAEVLIGISLNHFGKKASMKWCCRLYAAAHRGPHENLIVPGLMMLNWRTGLRCGQPDFPISNMSSSFLIGKSSERCIWQHTSHLCSCLQFTKYVQMYNSIPVGFYFYLTEVKTDSCSV